MLNIILFTSATNTSGGTRQALYLAQGLAEQGHAVRFFVPPHAALPELAPDAPFWRFFSAPSSWRQDIEGCMDELAQNGRPTVIHAFHNAAVKKAAWWGLFWKKKALTVAHRGVLFRPGNPLPYWSPGMDAFLVNSRACAKVLRGIGLSSKRLFYVPNCVPDSRLVARQTAESLRTELGMEPEAPLFLCIGNDNPNKGIKELLHAFALAFPEARSQTPMPHLALLGLTPALWQGLAEKQGLKDRIHCLGKSEEVGSYLAAATALVLPSFSESMPNTLLEAVRAGLPCIGTDVGAVSDVLLGEEYSGASPCGLVVPPGDVPALAQAMQSLEEKPELRAALAAAAKNEGERYRPEKRIRLVEEIYTQLLRKKGLL